MKQKSSFFKALGIMLLSVLFATQANAQNLTVTGTVTDNLGPVIGASIQVEGTSNGCITDIDGNYTLPNVPANATLVFSYIGYQTQKIAVGGKTKIDVKLAEDSQLLQEVVVVGYGVQRKSDLTGAVASVKAADALKNTPTGNVSDDCRDVWPVYQFSLVPVILLKTIPSVYVVSTLSQQKPVLWLLSTVSSVVPFSR